ncbi:MAG: nickel-binding protein, partial [Actinomycetota bacterium]
MPTFMDRHDNLDGADAAALAQAHLADLAAQDEFGVKYLTYWFDYDRQAAFCLVDAPDAETANQVHAHAHGSVASEIIPVDTDVVGAFLGRVTDPDPGPFEDSAFRAILFTDIVGSTAIGFRYGDDAAIALVERHDAVVRAALSDSSGREVKHTGDGIMASFRDATHALRAAVSIQRS